MKLRDCTARDVLDRLGAGSFYLDFGPFTFGLRSELAPVGHALHRLYHDFELRDEPEFVDHAISVTRRSLPLGRWRRGVSVLFNGYSLHGRFPVEQALANLEWGMNWCIHRHSFDFLTLHAATLERDGKALLLIGASGAGKSTLCAALALSGWRLLSDEIALVSLASGEIHALSRPIILKNDAIELVQRRWPDAAFGPACPGTVKGTVAHLRPPPASVERMSETATPGWICFPAWSPVSCELTTETRDPGLAFMAMAEHSFNYRILGEPGFHALLGLVRASATLGVRYHALDDALGFFDAL